MRNLAIGILLTLSSWTAALSAEDDHVVVVELFTSQGCSSCPPADALLHELATRDDVIPLAMHVDYWDYIGWKDPFGNAAHADRQRAYAALGNRRTIYTPEMVVQGATDIVGAKPMKLAEAILAHAEEPRAVDLTLARNGDAIDIRAENIGGDARPMTVYALRYTPKQTTKIKRGENRGKTLDYANVVEGLRVLGDWDGTGPFEATTPMDGDLPMVVLVQEGRTGPILAAARMR